MSYVQQLQRFVERNKKIKRFFAQGYKKSAIARHFGISRERVRQILSK